MKEYLDKKVAILEERLESSKVALKLQAEDYQRRLDILNHEAEQLKEMQLKYLPRETYEINHRLLEDKIAENQKLVYIGVGLALAIEIVLRFLK